MFAQFDTSLSGELRVKPEDVDCELHLVDHSLSRTVTRTEQFEVFEPVVASNAVDVVDGFFGTQRPTKMLRHNVPMLKNIAARFSRFARDEKANVAIASDSLGYFRRRVSILVGQSPKQRSTFSATQAFCTVESSAGSALYREHLLTLYALILSLVGLRFSTYRATWDRAIQRVFAVFFTVGSYACRFHAEFCATDGTREIGCRDTRVFTSKDVFVRRFASEPAKTLCGSTRAYFESPAATLTTFLDRHLCYSVWLGSFGVAWIADQVNRGR